MDTTPCHWCFAEVANHAASIHADWHRANGLHAASCARLKVLLRVVGDPGVPDLYRPDCDCGLVPA